VPPYSITTPFGSVIYWLKKKPDLGRFSYGGRTELGCVSRSPLLPSPFMVFPLFLRSYPSAVVLLSCSVLVSATVPTFLLVSAVSPGVLFLCVSGLRLFWIRHFWYSNRHCRPLVPGVRFGIWLFVIRLVSSRDTSPPSLPGAFSCELLFTTEITLFYAAGLFLSLNPLRLGSTSLLQVLAQKREEDELALYRSFFLPVCGGDLDVRL